MQNTDFEYRVGYSPLSGRLYAGMVRKDSGKWEGQPHDVTDRVTYSVGHFPLSDGRMLRLSAYVTDPEGAEVPDA
ncbi:MAG: hypothetical protein H6R25_2989 [Proteobacteria bacterium]|nr:hypothetical protein [Pseudomonadota bacterium]